METLQKTIERNLTACDDFLDFFEGEQFDIQRWQCEDDIFYVRFANCCNGAMACTLFALDIFEWFTDFEYNGLIYRLDIDVSVSRGLWETAQSLYYC